MYQMEKQQLKEMYKLKLEHIVRQRVALVVPTRRLLVRKLQRLLRLVDGLKLSQGLRPCSIQINHVLRWNVQVLIRVHHTMVVYHVTLVEAGLTGRSVVRA